MSTWSPAEFAALFQAWQEAIDTPLRERAKISHEVFRRFTAILGGVTLRSEGSVSFKQGSLKNMAQLVMAFGDRDTWFAFSSEQKKQWFKMVNRKSYKFIDLDRATFHSVERLIQLQSVSTNMRVTSATTVSVGTSVRVALRRNATTNQWEVQGTPLQSLAAINAAHAVDNTADGASSSNSSNSDATVAPRVKTKMREFPFPFPTASAAQRRTSTQSLFASGGGDRSAAATVDRSDSTRRNDVVLFDMGGDGDDDDDDSASSSDSDNDDDDDDLLAESEAVAARLKLFEAQSSSTLHQATASTYQAPAAAAQSSSPIRSVPLPLHPTQKRSRPASAPPIAPPAAAAMRIANRSPSSADNIDAKRMRVESDVIAAARALEAQAQTLTTLLAEIHDMRAARTSSSSNSVDNQHAATSDEHEWQAIADALELDTALRRSEATQRSELEHDKRQVLAALEQLQDQQQQLERQRRADDDARLHLLEALARDRDERRAFAETYADERREREAFRELLAQDVADRQRASEKQHAFVRRIPARETALAMHEGGASERSAGRLSAGPAVTAPPSVEQENRKPSSSGRTSATSNEPEAETEPLASPSASSSDERAPKQQPKKKTTSQEATSNGHAHPLEGVGRLQLP